MNGLIYMIVGIIGLLLINIAIALLTIIYEATIEKFIIHITKKKPK